MDLEQTTPIQAERIASRIIDGEALIVQSERGYVSVLNDVGTAVWDLCDGTRTVADIVQVVSRTHDVAEDAARADVFDFVRDLLDKGLLIPHQTSCQAAREN